MNKEFLKKIRRDYKYKCLNRMMNVLTEKGRRELLSPKLIEKLPFKNVLVLSPHPDDDVLGCGGAIIKHKRAGDTVSVICFTDGSRGNLQSERDESLISIRKEEMKKAHELLRIDRLFNIDAEDGKLAADDKIVDKTAEILKEISPDAIYIPFFIDFHKDHVETSVILLKGLNRSKFKGKCIAYEVNSPIFPNTILNISDCIDQKKDAVNCFKTQLSVNNYIHTVIEGLNRFRTNSVMLGQGYAEGFYLCDILFYKHLMESYFNENFSD
ncbi:PIG-L family deacetylase [bacterium]|nr:PIG-L family deacetylase [bacterium]